MRGLISPSLMCTDFRCLSKQIKILETAKVEYLHCDIMDGMFVPNFTLGTDILKTIRSMTSIPLDIHLMVMDPDRSIDYFEIKPGDIVCVHAETSIHLQRTLQKLRSLGVKAGVALNPATGLDTLRYILNDLDVILIMTVNPGYAGQKLVPATLEKISDTKKIIKDSGESILIEVDGNVNFENAKMMRAAGADIFVAGTSSIFMNHEKISINTNKLRDCII